MNLTHKDYEKLGNVQSAGINNPVGQPSVYFDADDFDSDIDLDIEDPATKGTVQYPSLPSLKPLSARDSGSGSLESTTTAGTLLSSSQPIPWSSSPISHFNPPPPRTKRRTLPWLANGVSASTARPSHSSQGEEDFEEDMKHAESKKRKSGPGNLAASRTAPNSVQSSSTLSATPHGKASYPWNTTASAVKQQQKSLREQNKKLIKVNETTGSSENKAVSRKRKNAVHRIFLSEEQQHVLNLVTEFKKSVFFTGSAGTGKSVLLREIIAALRKKYTKEPDRVAVTASTGLAACNIGGVTLHSFSGIGLGKESAEDLVKKIRRNPKAKQRWLRTKILVVDELSMVDGDLFDKLESIARTIRNNGRPFGGIQLVLTGDFFQLPPVPERGGQAKFAFDAGTWNTSIEHTIGLHQVFRQKDPAFAAMLNEMREGRLSNASIAEFKKLDRPLPTTDVEIEATELFPTRQEVERANTVRMSQLHGDTLSFQARDGGSITDKAQRDRLLANGIAPEVVNLKKGAQVMLIKNMDDTLVNGSLGRVTGFMTEQMFDMYKENEEAFLNGDAEGPTELEIRAKSKAALMGVTTQQVYPVVRFTIADGTTRDLLCNRESWKVEQPNGEVLASREQVPLILAWALSIHKAQGQTLERVRVDLGRVFEKGQAYVALSRATSMAGLQVLRFDPRKVQAHEKVRTFYSQLSRAELAHENTKSSTILGKLSKKAAVDYEKEYLE